MWFVLAHIHPIVQYDVYSQEPQLHVEPLAGEWGLQPHRDPQGSREALMYHLARLRAPLLSASGDSGCSSVCGDGHCPVIASCHA